MFLPMLNPIFPYIHKLGKTLFHFCGKKKKTFSWAEQLATWLVESSKSHHRNLSDNHETYGIPCWTKPWGQCWLRLVKVG